MASTYVNDLRIEEQATGENSGTWGTKVNSAFSQIAEAFSYGTKQLAADSNETFTMPDGTSDGTRSLYLKITSAGSLTATRTVTLGPNTVSKLWIIENATTGSQSITIAQGSGGSVTIPTGAVKMVYSDGAGAGAAVVDALTDVYLASVDHAAFGDNKKAIFGAGSDLQIYHDGSNSYIDEGGTGDLIIRGGADIKLQNAVGSRTYATFTNSGDAKLFYDNTEKIATTSTGIDVTGTVTADGLTVDSSSGITVNGPTNQDGKLNLVAYAGVQDAEARIQAARGNTTGTDSRLQFLTNNGTSLLTRVDINDNGDISFYEDTGTTAKFFWDASAESLGIGTSSPSDALHVLDSSGNAYASVARGSQSQGEVGVRLRGGTSGNDWYIYQKTSSDNLNFYNTADRLTIDSSGNLLVGKTSTAAGAGVIVGSTGVSNFTADGDRTLILNRETSDGDILEFRKNNATVGSIGTEGGDLSIGTGTNCGLQFNDGNAAIRPFNMASNAAVDAAVDLGVSGTRFKDLYLSGISYSNTVYSDLNLTLGADYNNNSSTGNSNILFQTDGSEKARIDSAGRLLVNTTSATTPAGTNSAYLVVQSDAGSGEEGIYIRGDSGVSDLPFVVGNSSNVARLQIYGDGDVENLNGTYGTLSDARVKENITDAGSQWEDLKALRVRKYNLIEKPDESHIGVVAQELEEAGMAGLVKEVRRDGMKSVKTSILYMKAIKALQEAMDRIETLEAKVAQLEGVN